MLEYNLRLLHAKLEVLSQKELTVLQSKYR